MLFQFVRCFQVVCVKNEFIKRHHSEPLSWCLIRLAKNNFSSVPALYRLIFRSALDLFYSSGEEPHAARERSKLDRRQRVFHLLSANAACYHLTNGKLNVRVDFALYRGRRWSSLAWHAASSRSWTKRCGWRGLSFYVRHAHLQSRLLPFYYGTRITLMFTTTT